MSTEEDLAAGILCPWPHHIVGVGYSGPVALLFRGILALSIRAGIEQEVSTVSAEHPGAFLVICLGLEPDVVVLAADGQYARADKPDLAVVDPAQIDLLDEDIVCGDDGIGPAVGILEKLKCAHAPPSMQVMFL